METNAYPCRSNYFCKTEFKATHTHVHTKHFWLQGYTSFCIQHCSLKTTLHITLVVLDDTRPIWRYFFISPPIKILDKQSLPGTYFLCEYVIQNLVALIITASLFHYVFQFHNGNLLDNYSPLHKHYTNLSWLLRSAQILNILETRIIWICAVLLIFPARDCSPWIPAVFGLSPVTARMGLAEHAFTHYQLTNYKACGHVYTN